MAYVLTLKKRMRLFEPQIRGGKRLVNVGGLYEIGKQIKIVGPEAMGWDHKTKLCLRLLGDPEQYVLVEEVCDEAHFPACDWSYAYEDSVFEKSEALRDKAMKKMEEIYAQLRVVLRTHIRPELKSVERADLSKSTSSPDSIPLPLLHV